MCDAATARLLWKNLQMCDAATATQVHSLRITANSKRRIMYKRTQGTR